MRNTITVLLGLIFTCELFAQSLAYQDTVFTSYLRKTQGWTAGDATISVSLPDGRNIWLFGDSYIDNVDTTDNSVPCLFNVRNCMMVQDSAVPADFATYIDTAQTGVNRTTFKLAINDTAIFWPGQGFVKDDTAFIFLKRIKNNNLAYLGTYIAKIHLPSLSIMSIDPLGDMNGINFGGAAIVDTPSNLLYIYGVKKDTTGIVFEPYLARCSLNNVYTNWEFYGGTGWNGDPALAKKISTYDVSPTYSVIKIQSKYYLISQQNGYLTCDLGRNIYSFESNTPEGDFVNKKTLYTIEDKYNGSYLVTYNACAHPQFTKNNELLISYNVNDHTDTVQPHVCPSQCIGLSGRRNADTYRAKFIRVPLSLIDSTLIFTEVNTATGDMPEIKIYPNPNNGELFIAAMNGHRQVFEISVSNLLGEELYRKQILNTTSIELPASGIYFVQIVNECKRQVFKVAVQK